MDDPVALRPPAESDLPLLDRLTRDPETTGEFAWFGYGGRPDWRKRWAENGLVGLDGGVLIVTRRDEPLGLVNWHKHQHTPASFSWEIGIALLPQARGKGYGTQAQRLIAKYLFAHTTAHRIWAGTEVDNIAEQKALEKAGFIREGVQRGTGWRDGAWRDGVVYSLLRTDAFLRRLPGTAATATGRASTKCYLRGYALAGAQTDQDSRSAGRRAQLAWISTSGIRPRTLRSYHDRNPRHPDRAAPSDRPREGQGGLHRPARHAAAG